MLEELSSFAFTASLPTASGVFSIEGQSDGLNDFRKIQTGLIYSRKLTKWLDIGAQFDYLHTRVSGYGTASGITFGLGTIFHWNKQWHTGLQVFNPIHQKYNGLGNDFIPAFYRFGLGFQPTQDFLISTELLKTADLPIEGTTVFHYKIIQHLSITGGVGTGESNFFFGFSLYLNQIQICLSSVHHTKLGLSPSTALTFENK